MFNNLVMELTLLVLTGIGTNGFKFSINIFVAKNTNFLKIRLKQQPKYMHSA